MSETLGSLVDKLCTVDLKMWNCQEGLYGIRRMTFEEFKKNCEDEDHLLILFELLKRSCDLNYQRNQLIDEIDNFLVDIIEGISLGHFEELKNQLIQLKHKTY